MTLVYYYFFIISIFKIFYCFPATTEITSIFYRHWWRPTSGGGLRPLAPNWPLPKSDPACRIVRSLSIVGAQMWYMRVSHVGYRYTHSQEVDPTFNFIRWHFRVSCVRCWGIQFFELLRVSVVQFTVWFLAPPFWETSQTFQKYMECSRKKTKTIRKFLKLIKAFWSIWNISQRF